MSLKIPGVGNILTAFAYSVASNSDGDVIVSISYYDTSNIKKYKCFELRCDKRFETPNAIEKAVNECLAKATGKSSVKIREDKERCYIHFGDCQFTGNILSGK